jgi:hypothetical protein
MFSIVGLDKDKAQKILPNAIKSGRYNTRKGIYSAMDGALIGKHIEEEALAYGYKPGEADKGGSITFARVKTDGSKLDAGDMTPMEFGGRLHYPDVNGVFRIVDNDFIKLQEGKFKEQEEYVNSILRKCLINNHLTAHLLGVSEAQLMNELSKGKDVVGSTDAQKEAFRDFSGVPEFLNVLDKNSVLFSGGVAKLRSFVKLHLPIIEGLTSKEVVEDAA